VPETRLEQYPLLKIHGSLDSLSYAERKLGEYILDNPRETIDSTIDALAEQSGSSYATISRFCKKMGYSGYKDFKKSLIDDVVSQKQDRISNNDLRVLPGLPAEQTIERICRFSERILRETETFMEPAQLLSAAQAIIAARSILCIGAGTSAITARYGYTRFFRLGLPCNTEPDPVVYSMRAASMTKEDLLFAVSSSGRTASVVEAAQAAGANGATVLSISDYAISPLNRVADVTLFTTPRTANIFMTMEMPLLIGQVLIIDALFGILATLVEETAGTVYQRTKDAADRSKL
jgi:RpiR family transcriptional regulator, carbohydrate utilization regulator